MRRIAIDRAIYEADDDTKTYRFLKRNPNWPGLSAEINRRNKQSIDGYMRKFRNKTTKKFMYKKS